MYIFLNGSTVTLLAWGLLPAESRIAFTWVTWFAAAAPLGILVAMGSLLALFLLLRPGRAAAPNRERLKLQLALLGPLTIRERTMVLVLAGTVPAWALAPAAGVDLAVVGIGALVACFLAGSFGTRELQSLDWSYLVFFGVALAIGRIFVNLGIDQALAEGTGEWLGPAGTDPLIFVLTAALATLVLRLIVPQSGGVLILVIGLLPLAWGAGVDPWIVAITVLATANIWFVVRQTPSYLAAYSLSGGRLFSHRQARVACAGFLAVTLIGLVLAVPYWHVLGLI